MLLPRLLVQIICHYVWSLTGLYFSSVLEYPIAENARVNEVSESFLVFGILEVIQHIVA